MTNCGCGALPARTSSASRIVSRTWLSSTARRCALKSRPSRGTLPCTAATVTAGRSPDPAPACRTCGQTSTAVSNTRQMQMPGSTTAGGFGAPASGGLGPPPPRDLQRDRGQARTHQHDRVDSSGTPPSWTSGSRGPSAWPKPRHPREIRRTGTIDFNHSCAAHTHRKPDRPAGQPAHHDGKQAEQRGKQRRTPSRAPARASSPPAC